MRRCNLRFFFTVIGLITTIEEIQLDTWAISIRLKFISWFLVSFLLGVSNNLDSCYEYQNPIFSAQKFSHVRGRFVRRIAHTSVLFVRDVERTHWDSVLHVDGTVGCLSTVTVLLPCIWLGFECNKHEWLCVGRIWLLRSRQWSNHSPFQLIFST